MIIAQTEHLTPLEYGRLACDTLMKRFAPQDLPPKGHFHYHQGVFLSGMQNIFHLCGEEKYMEYCREWVDSLIDGEGRVTGKFDPGQLDDIQPGVLLFDLYRLYGGEKYKKALYRLLPLIRDFPKTEEGGIWHKAGCAHQMWLDGLYMAGPVCTRFAKEFGETQYFDIAAFHALMMQKKTRDEKTGLWYHAWDSARLKSWANPETGLSGEFWGRSVGWVPVAVLDELDDIPAGHKDRQALISLVTDLLVAVSRYQDENTGLWYQVMDKGDRDDNWVEISCSCLFVAAISKAVRLGYLSTDYIKTAKKGYEGVISTLTCDESGLVIGGICVGTGVGGYEHYIKRPVRANDLHGVGAFVLMCAECQRLAEQDCRRNV